MEEKTDRTFSYHRYDVNLVELYSRIEKCYSENNLADSESKLLHLKEDIKDYCELLGKNFSLFEQNLPLIVDSSDNFFEHYFSWSLAFYDVNLIRIYLNHHRLNFKGNNYTKKEEFCGRVEFYIYKNVKGISVEDTEKRLEIISQWIENNKVFPSEQRNTMQPQETDAIYSNPIHANPIKKTETLPTKHGKDIIKMEENLKLDTEYNINYFNENCFLLFNFFIEYYEKTGIVKYINIYYFLKMISIEQKEKYSLSIKIKDYKKMIKEKFNIEIKKFERAKYIYEDKEVPILKNLEKRFSQMSK